VIEHNVNRGGCTGEAQPPPSFAMKRYFLLILLAATAACRAAPPKFEYRGTHGIARSDCPGDARYLATTADALAHRVCERLDIELTPPFVIYHYFDSEATGVLVERKKDRMVDRWILIGEFALRYQPRFTVAHELVHWYVCPPWDRLPHVVEEGLADFIAIEFDPRLGSVRVPELEHRIAEITAERRTRTYAITNRTMERTPEDVKSDMYAVGFEIVRRLGLERLRELCERAEREALAEAPIEWFE
jgi:hypothetical protein